METILKIREICNAHHSCYDNCPFHADNECILETPPANWSTESIGKALKGEVSSCSECEFFSDTQFYADNSIFVSCGSCMKCQRNMATTNPYQEIPTWCPLKGDKDEKESTSQSNN